MELRRKELRQKAAVLLASGDGRKGANPAGDEGAGADPAGDGGTEERDANLAGDWR
jgi:hypothetical protein